MSSFRSLDKTPTSTRSYQEFDVSESGRYTESSKCLAQLPRVYVAEKALRSAGTLECPDSCTHEVLTPTPTVPTVPLATMLVVKQPLLKLTPIQQTHQIEKINKRILFSLWFNTYRQFFTFIILLNLAGIILAGLGKFPYAQNHLGAMVLGNLLFAVLMRNELFLRLLYMVTIYSLRSVGFSRSCRETSGEN